MRARVRRVRRARRASTAARMRRGSRAGCATPMRRVRAACADAARGPRRRPRRAFGRARLRELARDRDRTVRARAVAALVALDPAHVVERRRRSRRPRSARRGRARDRAPERRPSCARSIDDPRRRRARGRVDLARARRSAPADRAALAARAVRDGAPQVRRAALAALDDDRGARPDRDRRRLARGRDRGASCARGRAAGRAADRRRPSSTRLAAAPAGSAERVRHRAGVVAGTLNPCARIAACARSLARRRRRRRELRRRAPAASCASSSRAKRRGVRAGGHVLDGRHRGRQRHRAHQCAARVLRAARDRAVRHARDRAADRFCDDVPRRAARRCRRARCSSSAYAIDRDEVSVADYRACVAAGACTLDPLIAGDERYIHDEWPMVNVTWQEAQELLPLARRPAADRGRVGARGARRRAGRPTWPWGERREGCVERRDFNHGQPRAQAMREIERTGRSSCRSSSSAIPTTATARRCSRRRAAIPWGEGPYGTRDQAGNVAEWTADARGTRGRRDEGLPTARWRVGRDQPACARAADRERAWCAVARGASRASSRARTCATRSARLRRRPAVHPRRVPLRAHALDRAAATGAACPIPSQSPNRSRSRRRARVDRTAVGTSGIERHHWSSHWQVLRGLLQTSGDVAVGVDLAALALALTCSLRRRRAATAIASARTCSRRNLLERRDFEPLDLGDLELALALRALAR